MIDADSNNIGDNLRNYSNKAYELIKDDLQKQALWEQILDMKQL